MSSAPDSLWSREDSPLRRAAVWVLAILILASFGGALAVFLSSRPNPADGVRTLLTAIKTSDEAGYARMSQRYRNAHELVDFRRGLARVSELRSAENLARTTPLGLFERPERVEFCSNFADVEGVLRVHVVWEDSEWFVDALAVDDNQLDPDHAAGVVCGPLR